MIMINKKIALFLLVVLILNYSNGQTKEDVVEKYMEAVGGVEKWKTLQSVVLSMTQYPKEESVIKIASIHNGQVYDRWISFSNAGDSSTTCFNGDKYWRQVKGGPPNHLISTLHFTQNTHD